MGQGVVLDGIRKVWDGDVSSMTTVSSTDRPLPFTSGFSLLEPQSWDSTSGETGTGTGAVGVASLFLCGRQWCLVREVVQKFLDGRSPTSSSSYWLRPSSSSRPPRLPESPFPPSWTVAGLESRPGTTSEAPRKLSTQCLRGFRDEGRKTFPLLYSPLF